MCNIFWEDGVYLSLPPVPPSITIMRVIKTDVSVIELFRDMSARRRVLS
jgi:hypothetical protein